MSTALAVYLRSPRGGRLWLDARSRYSFRYDSTWLTADEGLPLSLGLPLREAPHRDDEARPFFANLLPESGLRRVIAHRLDLSEGNEFTLLEAVGGECARAVSVLPEGVAPRDDGAYRCLEDAELDALMAELPRRPLLAGEAGIRLSLAEAFRAAHGYSEVLGRILGVIEQRCRKTVRALAAEECGPDPGP